MKFVVSVLLALVMLTATSPAVAQEVPIADYADALSIDQLVDAENYSDKLDAPVLRLYQAFFNRSPDLAGAKYWLGIRRAGYTLTEIARFMAGGVEYQTTFANNSDGQFLQAVYRNVLGRDFDQRGFDYWIVLLVAGQLDRIEVVFYVTQNPEFVNAYPFSNSRDGVVPTPGRLVLTGCLRQEEEVRLENPGDLPVALRGWRLEDDGARHSIDLGDLSDFPGTTIDVLPAGGFLAVLSGDNPIAGPWRPIGWNNDVWNNDGDTAHLISPSGVVSRMTCTN